MAPQNRRISEFPKKANFFRLQPSDTVSMSASAISMSPNDRKKLSTVKKLIQLDSSLVVDPERQETDRVSKPCRNIHMGAPQFKNPSAPKLKSKTTPSKIKSKLPGPQTQATNSKHTPPNTLQNHRFYQSQREYYSRKHSTPLSFTDVDHASTKFLNQALLVKKAQPNFPHEPQEAKNFLV